MDQNLAKSSAAAPIFTRQSCFIEISEFMTPHELLQLQLLNRKCYADLVPIVMNRRRMYPRVGAIKFARDFIERQESFDELSTKDLAYLKERVHEVGSYGLVNMPPIGNATASSEEQDEIVWRPRTKVCDGFYTGYWKKLQSNAAKDGSARDGQVQNENYCYHGFGKLEYGTYGVFEGQWCDGKVEGLGRLKLGLIHPNNMEIYFGMWSSNAKCGRGIQLFTDGSIYIGDWKANMRHGYGTMTYKEPFKEFGEATQTNSQTLATQGVTKHAGFWENNKKHGLGRTQRVGEAALRTYQTKFENGKEIIEYKPVKSAHAYFSGEQQFEPVADQQQQSRETDALIQEVYGNHQTANQQEQEQAIGQDIANDNTENAENGGMNDEVTGMQEANPPSSLAEQNDHQDQKQN